MKINSSWDTVVSVSSGGDSLVRMSKHGEQTERISETTVNRNGFVVCVFLTSLKYGCTCTFLRSNKLQTRSDRGADCLTVKRKLAEKLPRKKNNKP